MKVWLIEDSSERVIGARGLFWSEPEALAMAGDGESLAAVELHGVSAVAMDMLRRLASAPDGEGVRPVVRCTADGDGRWKWWLGNALSGDAVIGLASVGWFRTAAEARADAEHVILAAALEVVASPERAIARTSLVAGGRVSGPDATERALGERARQDRGGESATEGPPVEASAEVVLAKLIRLIRWREGFRGAPPVPRHRTAEAVEILRELDSYADRVLGAPAGEGE